MLSEKEFLVLNYCRKNEALSQRDISAKTQMSVGSVNAAVKECTAQN